MGCFNTTCFVSGQTIAPRDPCYVLPIQQAASYNPMKISHDETRLEVSGVAHTTCYPHCFWEAAGSFLAGTYDDYGQVALDDTPANNLRLTEFARTLLEETFVVEVGENEVHEVPVDFKAFMQENTPELYLMLTNQPTTETDWHEQLITVWEHYEEVSCEYRVFVADYDGRPRQLVHAVIHKAAFDKLVDLAGGVESQRKLVTAALDKCRKYLGNEKSAWMAGDSFASGLRYVGCREGHLFSDEFPVFAELLERLGKKEFDEDTFFTKVKPWLDARYVMEGLDTLNVKLSPMVYASQDYSNEIGRDFAKFVSEVALEVTAFRRELYAEDEEDDGEDAEGVTLDESTLQELKSLEALLGVAESCEPGVLTPEYIQEYIRNRKTGVSIEQAAEATYQFIGGL